MLYYEDHDFAAADPAHRVPLNDGRDIPVLGFGTSGLGDHEATVSAVASALKAGYRHIDTAQMYHNEDAVGEGVRQSGVPREEIFITTKLDNDRHSYDDARNSLSESLQRLQMDYVDLFLIHWPEPEECKDNWQEANRGAWKAMMELRDEGKIRSIGVSNFHPHHFEELLKDGGDMPTVNQIKLGPGYTQDKIVSYCRENEIVLTAYSPLGKAKGFENQTIVEIAEKHGKKPAQVVLRWSLQMGFIPLPRSSNDGRIKQNTELFDFELTEGEMEALLNLKGFME